MDLRQLQISLEKNKIESVYFIYSEDVFLADQALSAIQLKALNPEARDFNFDRFYATETTAAHVRDAVEMLPVLSPRRLVIYKGVDALKEESWAQLMPLIDNPIETSCLVLVSSKMDKRKKHFKTLIEKACFIELKKPFENQIQPWISYIASTKGIQLTPEAMSLVQQLVGTNLSEIDSELEKLKCLDIERTKFDSDDVLKIVSRARIESVFHLTEALARKDRAQALLSLAHLLENGQNEIGIVSLILRQVRILAQVKAGLREGLSVTKLSQKIGVPEFFMKKYLAQSRGWDDYKINATIKALHETDKALKSSPVSSHIWLENFVIKTC